MLLYILAFMYYANLENNKNIIYPKVALYIDYSTLQMLQNIEDKNDYFLKDFIDAVLQKLGIKLNFTGPLGEFLVGK